MSSLVDDLIDLIGRILFCHSIAPDHLRRVLGGNLAEAEAIVAGHGLRRPLDKSTVRRLELFASVLLRVEWRSAGDSRAIRDALSAPLDALDGRSPASQFAGGIEALHAVRHAVDTIAAPQVRWWRVGH